MKFRRSTVRIKKENKPIYDEWKDGRANQHVTNDIMNAIVEGRFDHYKHEERPKRTYRLEKTYIVGDYDKINKALRYAEDVLNYESLGALVDKILENESKESIIKNR